MKEFTFASEKDIDVIAVGRIAIDLNPNEIHRTLDKFNIFTKRVSVPSLWFWRPGQAVSWQDRPMTREFMELFNLSVKETIRSWCVMETAIFFMGLAGVLLIHYVIS